MAQISYTNKVALNVNPEIADINKVTDNDMNQIKSVVNDNYNKTIQITDTQPTDSDNKIWIDNGEIQNAGSELAISINEPTHGEQVWFQPSKNLFDGAIELGTISSETGQNNDNNNRKRSKNYTEVLPNTTYTISFDQEVAVIIFEYASDKSYIGRIPNNDTWGDQPFTFKTSATTKYVKFATYTTLENQAQIELGNVATTITPKENKIYTNQHGEYNTFYDSSNVENYSIAETRIGTWIDLKPLYRKVFTGTLGAAGDNGAINLTSYNIDTITNIYGFYGYSSTSSFLATLISSLH